MIKCPKCKGLNSNESVVCGSCGAKLEPHKGAKPIIIKPEETEKLTRDEIIEIILYTVFILSYFIAFDMAINAIIGAVALVIARKRKSAILEVIAWLGMAPLIGTLVLELILMAWGLA